MGECGRDPTHTPRCSLRRGRARDRTARRWTEAMSSPPRPAAPQRDRTARAVQAGPARARSRHARRPCLQAARSSSIGSFRCSTATLDDSTGTKARVPLRLARWSGVHRQSRPSSLVAAGERSLSPSRGLLIGMRLGEDPSGECRHRQLRLRARLCSLLSSPGRGGAPLNDHTAP